ncbi:MAG TPA: hypothetical protein VKY74_12370 [Chloroflexia bacterium]|nr:hypothetical protein [Chloroflexia bacterium]
MSTNIYVFPHTNYIPSFAEFLDVATPKLHGFLAEIGSPQAPRITATLHVATPETEDQLLPLDLAAPLRWREEEDEYAFFDLRPIPGGTDAYFRIMDSSNYRAWAGEIKSRPPARQRKDWVKACLAQRYYWRFRRSLGQAAVINVLYGLLAAALAELTDGMLYSADGAWDYDRFPATAAEFSQWYFRPALALEEDSRDWAARCIAMIPEELRTGEAWPDV